MKTLSKTLLACALTIGVINTVSAYIGPGAGLSLLGALWGLLAAVFVSLAFVLLWPFRRMLTGRRNRKANDDGTHTRTPDDLEGGPASNSAKTNSRRLDA
jgi:membrane protein implicated in regulation of membrane protease activity